MCNVAVKRFCGRIAIVTGSTKGIGFAIARRLAEEGAKVIISSRKKENVDNALEKLQKDGLDVSGLVCHVAKAKDRKNLFAQARVYGGLDILVSNAAVSPQIGGVLDCSEAAWDKLFEVNVKSAFLLAKEALPLIKKSKHGRIIFISSVLAFNPHDLLGALSVSKTALLGLTKAAALQLANEEITVNSVAPGVVDTKFARMLTSDENIEHEVLARIPMNRLGKPHEISAVVAFLASDDGSYITGENIAVSGGMSSRL